MQTFLNELLSRVSQAFKWWIVIAPWEMALRVRMGKKPTLLGPGINFVIPGLDRIFIQNTRKRFLNVPTQTVTTKDNKVLTISGGVSYAIDNIELLYSTLHDAHSVLEIQAMSLIARFCVSQDLVDAHPLAVETFVNDHLDFSEYGLGDVEFKLTDYVTVKTYRIINDSFHEFYGNGINTTSTGNND